jgi:hypothetical protein
MNAGRPKAIRKKRGCRLNPGRDLPPSSVPSEHLQFNSATISGHGGIRATGQFGGHCAGPRRVPTSVCPKTKSTRLPGEIAYHGPTTSRIDNMISRTGDDLPHPGKLAACAKDKWKNRSRWSSEHGDHRQHQTLLAALGERRVPEQYGRMLQTPARSPKGYERPPKLT